MLKQETDDVKPVASPKPESTTPKTNTPIAPATSWQWTDIDPDVEFIEPPIKVSIDKNWLVFGHCEQLPAQCHVIRVSNFGPTPVAFKVMTSDNYSYCVSQKSGIVPCDTLGGFHAVKIPNFVDITISKRPNVCVSRQDLPKRHTPTFPRKDRLFIDVMPTFSWSLPPRACFTSCTRFERLRVCLQYTASEQPEASSFLHENMRGWNTWQANRFDVPNPQKSKDRRKERHRSSVV